MERQNSVWQVAGGNLEPLEFHTDDNAKKALSIISEDEMGHQCFIGSRSTPAMMYWLTRGSSPKEPGTDDENCTRFDNTQLRIVNYYDDWRIYAGNQYIKRFTGRQAAEQSLEIIKFYDFSHHCTIGRRLYPSVEPAMEYWRK